MNRKILSGLLLFVIFALAACSSSEQGTDVTVDEQISGDIVPTEDVIEIEPDEARDSDQESPRDDSSQQPEFEALPEPNPVDLNITYQEGNAVQAEVGYEGGSLEATDDDGTRFILEIPPEALFSPELIRMTPAAAVEGIPFEIDTVASVQLEPEGLVFFKPILLRILLPDGQSVEETATFSTYPGGKDFHLYPTKQEANEVQLFIYHFSDYGAIHKESGMKQEIERVKDQYTPSLAETYSRDQAWTILNLVDDPQDQIDAMEKILKNWFYSSVFTRLKNAAVYSDRIDQAVGEYLAWRDFANTFDLLIGTDGELEKRLKDENEKALDAIAVALKNGFEQAHKRCVQENEPDEALKMLRWGLIASYFDVWGRQGFNKNDALEKLKSCFNFDFVFRSRVEGNDADVSFTSQVLATIPLNITEFDYYGGRIGNSGDLKFEINQVIPLKPGCKNKSNPGRLHVNMAFDMNLSLAEPSVKQGLRSIMGLLENPEEIVSCISNGVKLETKVLRWLPFFSEVNRPFIDEIGAFNIELPIVRKGEVYAEIELHGPIPDVPNGQERTKYQVIHKPNR